MIRSIEVHCDWPGCTAQAELGTHPEAFFDFHWTCHGEVLGGWHLCPDHRFKTREDVVEAKYGRRTEAKAGVTMCQPGKRLSLVQMHPSGDLRIFAEGEDGDQYGEIVLEISQQDAIDALLNRPE